MRRLLRDPSRVLRDHLTKNAVQPSAVVTTQIVIKPTTSAFRARPPIGGVAVRLQRPAHRPDHMIAEREDRLTIGNAHPQQGGRHSSRLGIVGCDALHELGDDGDGIERLVHGPNLGHSAL
jgi:hypothetical protein